MLDDLRTMADGGPEQTLTAISDTILVSGPSASGTTLNPRWRFSFTRMGTLLAHVNDDDGSAIFSFRQNPHHHLLI